MKKLTSYILSFLGLATLIGFEIASVYYIMPFPGSQQQEAIELSYFLVNHIQYFRWAGVVLLIYPVYYFVTSGTNSQKILLVAVSLLYLMIYYQINFRMQADAMFKQPEIIHFSSADENKVNRRNLVIGIEVKGQSRAYPIEIIGYHHQVRDTIGGESIMVTYCTVCRTGRVYKPLIAGQREDFRLVGMDQFNAMFEDSRTKSWWRQVNGEAVAGPLKGTQLEEIPSQQMSLLSWIDQHPNTRILQPDSTFKEAYAGLEKFDEGTLESGLEKRDSLSWKEKSWVVGIQYGTQSKAYDWNDLLTTRVVNDKVGDLPVLLVLEPDSVSFHAWNRDTLEFSYYQQKLIDRQTNSQWNWNGHCIEGPLKGTQLNYIQAYQEFWHSWRTFHPGTQSYPR